MLTANSQPDASVNPIWQGVNDTVPKVGWRPLDGSQTLALSCPADIILFHGTRGPGKTDAQLMRFKSRVGKGYGAFWRGIIFDREYKNLDDLIAKSVRWFNGFGDGAKFLSSKSDYRWVWPTGEELYFRHIKRPNDYWAYHGQEFPFIGWNEITKYPTGELFESMMSCNRSSFRPEDHPIRDANGNPIGFLPELPLEVFATTNPYGPGFNWVKKRFILAGAPGQIVRRTTTVFNPRTQQEEEVTRTQTHIFGSYRENKYLSPAYVAELASMKDKNKRKAWLGGSWDIIAGGMFDDLWDSNVHVVPSFTVPRGWHIDRSFDWGSARPFSVGWWAESDGSDLRLANGAVMSTVKGDLFRIGEWYGCVEGESNVGLNLTNAAISKGIIEREIAMGIYGRVKAGPADNSINQVINGTSIAKDMRKPIRLDNGKRVNGVYWTKSDKSGGSRVNGWQLCRARLEASLPPQNGPREFPGLFVVDSCEAFRELFPTLPRSEKNPDDVDSDAEDHIGDETRYKVLSAGRGGRVGSTIGT